VGSAGAPEAALLTEGKAELEEWDRRWRFAAARRRVDDRALLRWRLHGQAFRRGWEYASRLADRESIGQRPCRRDRQTRSTCGQANRARWRAEHVGPVVETHSLADSPARMVQLLGLPLSPDKAKGHLVPIALIPNASSGHVLMSFHPGSSRAAHEQTSAGRIQTAVLRPNRAAPSPRQPRSLEPPQVVVRMRNGRRSGRGVPGQGREGSQGHLSGKALRCMITLYRPCPQAVMQWPSGGPAVSHEYIGTRTCPDSPRKGRLRGSPANVIKKPRTFRLRKIRLRFEKIVQNGPGSEKCVTMGKRLAAKKTPRAKEDHRVFKRGRNTQIKLTSGHGGKTPARHCCGAGGGRVAAQV